MWWLASRLRTPAGAVNNVFPGDQLTIDGSGVFENGTLNAVGELRFKNNSVASTNYFDNLVLSGGQLDLGDNTLEDIQGQMNVAGNSTIYVDSSGANRTYRVEARLTGSGNLLWHEFSGGLGGDDLQITCPTNSFNGQWLVDQGVLMGVGTASLGTNNILVGVSGLSAAIETLYDIHNTNGSLILGANGKMYLHQSDTFKSALINGNPLAPGTYSFVTLNSAYPGYFPSSWTLQNGSPFNTGSGSITVLANPTPIIMTSPQPVSLYLGQMAATFSVTAVGATPLSYRWFTNGTVVLTDNANRTGSTSNVLTIPIPTLGRQRQLYGRSNK